MKYFFLSLNLFTVCTPSPLSFSQSILRATRWTHSKQYWLNPVPDSLSDFLLPFDDDESSQRIIEISLKRRGFRYGPSLLGNTSYFPTGVLGNALVQQHVDQWLRDANDLTHDVEEEVIATQEALQASGGFLGIKDYHKLYDGQWGKSIPNGIAPGMLSNGSQDLLFSMERLSVNPYAVKRLHPLRDTLPFELDPCISRQISTYSLDELHQSGRLFFVDHSYQADYPISPGRYAAATSAYFFIHPLSYDFLPLAVKTNVGADLVYTPLDTTEDWLLAKTMFNSNDLFHGQIFHLANSHAVCEIVHQAALRTLSERHPVLGLLDHLMHTAYAIRPMGERVLFNPGGFYDQSFAITNEGVRKFATEFYPQTAGSFEANYFWTDLTSRGLINCTYGPELKDFPFFQDASRMHSSIRKFMASCVSTYYATQDRLKRDNELQSFIQEAIEQASVLDFPQPPLLHKDTLVDILTQVAFLTGVSHHVLNSGEPAVTSGVLPYHPSALYAPPPVSKGIKDLMPFLTSAEEAVKHVALLARFNRPGFKDKHETLLYMFSSPQLMARCPPRIRRAAEIFHQEMQDLSDEIGRRHFDDSGLSQGMPFVWRAIDPARIPYFLST